MDNEDLSTLEDLYMDFVMIRKSMENELARSMDRLEGKILDAMRKKQMEIEVSLIEAEKHAIKEAV